jgi:hypothetical protein
VRRFCLFFFFFVVFDGFLKTKRNWSVTQSCFARDTKMSSRFSRPNFVRQIMTVRKRKNDFSSLPQSKTNKQFVVCFIMRFILVSVRRCVLWGWRVRLPEPFPDVPSSLLAILLFCCPDAELFLTMCKSLQNDMQREKVRESGGFVCLCNF